MWTAVSRPGGALLILVLVVAGILGLQWCFAQPAVEPQAAGKPVPFPDAGTVRLNTNGLQHAYGTLSQPTTFTLAPASQPSERQMFRLDVCSGMPQAVSWDEAGFGAKYGLALPTTTRGDNTCDMWGFIFHGSERKWFFMATTPPRIVPE